MSRTRIGLIAAALGLAALALYSFTLTPTVALIDSGELVTAAHSLGVAHPPGFPSYLILAHLATRVPVGSVAQRANFASALFAALAVAMLALALAQALRSPAVHKDPGKSTAPRGKVLKRVARMPETASPSAPAAPGARDRFELLIPIVVAAAAFACSRTLWAYATVAEVYTLNTLVNATVLALVLSWRRRRLQSEATGDRWLWAAAWLFGFGLGVHIVTVGVLLPGIALLILSADRGVFHPRRLLPAALFACAGLSVYAYLPLAAAHDPIMNWGDPDNAERFLRHVTGRQYWVSFSLSGSQLSQELGVLGRLLMREFGSPWLPLVLVLALVGWVDTLRRDRGLAAGLALIALADVAYSVSYQIAEDKDAYYLPVFLVIALAAGLGAAALLRARVGRALPAQVRRLALAAVLLALPAVTLSANRPFCDRHRDTIARDYVRDALSTVQPGGLLLTGDWQLYAPLFYLQEVERFRPELVAIDVRLMRRSWYYDQLRARFPAFMAQHRAVVDAFLDDLRAWERNPAEFELDAARLRRIDDRFFGMILGMIRRQLPVGPVYVTQEVALMQQGEDALLAQGIMRTYLVVPQGLVLEVRTPGVVVDPATPPLAIRSLNEGRERFDDDDVVTTKVRPVYAAMLLLRGRYLASTGRHEQAIEAFGEALTVHPGLPSALAGLDESRRALAAAPE